MPVVLLYRSLRQSTNSKNGYKTSMSKSEMVDNATLAVGVAVLVIVITFKALRSSTMSDELVCRLIYKEKMRLSHRLSHDCGLCANTKILSTIESI